MRIGRGSGTGEDRLDFGLLLRRLVLAAGAFALVLIPVAFALNWIAFQWEAPAKILAWLMRELYFTLLPGVIYIILFLTRENSAAGDSKAAKVLQRSDWLKIGGAGLAVALFAAAYGSPNDSFFHRIDPLFPFLETRFYGLPYFESSNVRFGPDLFTFVLYHSAQSFLVLAILVFRSLTRIGLDRTKVGAIVMNSIIAVALALGLARAGVFRYLEESSVALLYQYTRNYQGEDGPNGLPYCPTQELIARYEAALKQEEQQALAENRPYSVVLEEFPTPPGVREDIRIIGVTTQDIERNGGWPLDWQLYADITNRMAKAENNILVFDINFLDAKGVFGAGACESLMVCSPRPGVVVRRQDELFAEAMHNSPNKVIADYPIESTTEQFGQLQNYSERLRILDQKSAIRNVHNGDIARIQAQLPVPPIAVLGEQMDTMGYANVFPDEDTKINRRVPLVLRVPNLEKLNASPEAYDPSVDDRYYPSVALSAALTYFGVDPVKDVEIDFLKGYVLIKNIPERTFQEVDNVRLEVVNRDIMRFPTPDRSLRIPIDQDGFMNINFRGGLYCFRYNNVFNIARDKSVADIASTMKDKIVLVAMYYATGVDTAKDIHLSPYGNMAGIEHQAYAINTILNQDFALQAPPWVNLLILVAVALLAAWFQPRVSTGLSFLISIGIMALYLALTVLLTFGVYSYIHTLPTVLVEQIVILVAFIGFRIFAEEENVKYIRNTFSKFVSQDVVNELLANPEAIALGGSKKEISVFFSDVRGFTTISEALGPEDLVQLLNEYLSEMTELIIHYRGTIDKYMGDAIMAFWGAPVHNDEHAYFACVAALAQSRRLKELQQVWKERGNFSIDIGIGINTGFAVVGNMGSSRRMDYTAMGDTINLGSRLEGITKTYGVKICISEFTYAHVKDRVFARELDVVRVKGKHEPVRIYELMGLKDESDLDRLIDVRTAVGASA
ncbi:MAG: adenylate/guanylate cyclase domain-containing protein [Leptospirales bacterium]|nr:adenylate/guanylate cyclase domain-containing protein [Leptospirales bacterium]